MNSKFILSILFVLSTTQVLVARTSPFIIGGEEARIGEIPFMVSLHTSYGHFCGGSLVAPNWVLTAAHCVRGENIHTIKKIYVGLHNQKATQGVESFKATRIITHPSYNKVINYDYALIQLDGKSQQKPIELHQGDIRIQRNQSTLMVTAAGWGLMQEGSWSGSDVLRKVTMPLVSKETCLQSYPGKITDQMLCAGFSEGGKDSCQMDSGGPLFTRKPNGAVVLIGIVSWGEGCARPTKYGVYAKVSEAIDWIQSELNSNH